jgi:hypothetical protein
LYKNRSVISLKKVCMDTWEPWVIWPYGIWPKMALICVSTETSIKMQHSGKGIKLIGPSYYGLMAYFGPSRVRALPFGVAEERSVS